MAATGALAYDPHTDCRATGRRSLGRRRATTRPADLRALSWALDFPCAPTRRQPTAVAGRPVATRTVVLFADPGRVVAKHRPVQPPDHHRSWAVFSRSLAHGRAGSEGLGVSFRAVPRGRKPTNGSLDAPPPWSPIAVLRPPTAAPYTAVRPGGPHRRSNKEPYDTTRCVYTLLERYRPYGRWRTIDCGGDRSLREWVHQRTRPMVAELARPVPVQAIAGSEFSRTPKHTTLRESVDPFSRSAGARWNANPRPASTSPAP